MKKPVVLIVDDESFVREFLEILLRDDYEVVATGDGLDAIEIVRSSPIDMVLLDMNLPDIKGHEALKIMREDLEGDLGVVVISAIDSAQKAVQALKLGAYDYITKPFAPEDLLTTLKRYFDNLELKREVQYLREELKNRLGEGKIISRSPAMKSVFDHIDKVSLTSTTVLITGESGTGKELVARAIQSKGARNDKPFVAVNCGAIPAELIESELFGHEKGAFTGAHAKKMGKFEFADGGTLFLDEISTMPMHLQVKLLRVLQEKSFERVGGNQPIKVDVRVIAATNTNLEDAVSEGTFREDLYYRLKVVPIDLPPLRKRREDIPLLVQHFIDQNTKKFNKTISGISQDAVRLLTDFNWPGNIRELENLMERMVVLAKNDSELTTDDLPVGMVYTSAQTDSSGEIKDFKEACKAFERHFIVDVLNRTGWNRSEAAGVLKIHRNTLLSKMKDLEIKERRHKTEEASSHGERRKVI